MSEARRNWLIDLVAGGLVGAVVGAIVAVNVVIYSGIDQGYEASIADVFRQNVIVGVVTALVLLAGPIVGVVTARKMRRRRVIRSSPSTRRGESE